MSSVNKIGRYEVRRKLGEGGMGEVFLAQDTKLGRKVAVKILSNYFGDNQENLKRFMREAKTASSLNHPNIVTIFEASRTEEGEPYIVMQLVDGLSLLCARERLTLAQWLAAQPAVRAVHYPGLVAHPQHALASELFRAYGGLLSFELADGVDTFAVLNRLRYVVLSSNLGDNRTLAIPVAQTIFYEMGAERRAAMGIAESLVRVSVGIEDRDDLIADFAQAIN